MTEFISAGSLEVSGTLTFPIDDPDAFAGLLGFTSPPRHEMRFDYPEGADRHCPVCQEPAEAVVIEDALLVPATGVSDGETVAFSVVGVNPSAYRAEPCGHRFGRDGKEITN